MRITDFKIQISPESTCAFLTRKIGYIVLAALVIGCQESADRGDWLMYKADAGSSSYSSLNQINKKNVDQLEVAWTYRTGDVEEGEYSTMETNPIIVDDVLYGASPLLKVFALDASTGEEHWRFDPFGNDRARGYIRGVVYWEDGEDQRILFSAGSYLHALDAKDGTLVREFGDNGRVDLNVGLGRKPDAISVQAPSPGIIYEDLLILGSAVGESYEAAPGDIRAYNVRTGEIEWTFHTIPRKNEPGSETWAGGTPDSMRQRGGANNWAGMALDKDRGMVFIPLGSPVYDFYGGNRLGKNLYGNSLLALDAASGDYRWHYQTVYHDLWDYDLPAPPNLLTVEHDGEMIDAVAQVTKIGFTYLFERDTGRPLFSIDEKPVPPSFIEGEKAWPTQPIPSRPEPFVRQNITKQDLADFSSEAHDSVLKKFNDYRYEGLFTPPDPRGTITFPSTRGGANWGGAAYDENSGLLIINANETPEITTVKQVKQEVDPDKSLYEKGEIFYNQNCASCHGADLEGQHTIYPALANIEENLTKKEVLRIIQQGGGMMPAFPSISAEEKEAIIAFLYNSNGQSKPESVVKSIHAPEKSAVNDGRYINLTAYSRFEGPDGLPAIRPPWGTLNAVNLNTGKIEWRIPLGTHPDVDSEEPTGLESWGGPIVTAGGMVFIGGTSDKNFRAFDVETGDLLWETTLPAGGFATPATYMSDGKQFVVIAAGGGRGTKPGDYYIAFALPD